MPVPSLTTEARCFEDPSVVVLVKGVPAGRLRGQSFDELLFRLNLCLAILCFGSLRRACINAPDQRVSELEILIVLKQEVDSHPEEGRVTTDLADDCIERFDGPSYQHRIS